MSTRHGGRGICHAGFCRHVLDFISGLPAGSLSAVATASGCADGSAPGNAAAAGSRPGMAPTSSASLQALARQHKQVTVLFTVRAKARNPSAASPLALLGATGAFVRAVTGCKRLLAVRCMLMRSINHMTWFGGREWGGGGVECVLSAARPGLADSRSQTVWHRDLHLASPLLKQTLGMVQLSRPAMHRQQQITMPCISQALCHAMRGVMVQDIVGFTAMSEQLEPGQVLGFVNDVFAMLDSLADRHGVFKVPPSARACMHARTHGAPAVLRYCVVACMLPAAAVFSSGWRGPLRSRHLTLALIHQVLNAMHTCGHYYYLVYPPPQKQHVKTAASDWWCRCGVTVLTAHAGGHCGRLLHRGGRPGAA